MSDDKELFQKLKALDKKAQKQKEEDLQKLREARKESAIATELLIDHFEVILKLGRNIPHATTD